MSVNIKFEPSGRDGLIAEGTYLWDAAKRLGVQLPAECEGRGECDTCAVIVEQGATLLSSLTEAERERLSPERLAAGERLACQTKIERGGELVLRAVPVTERAETTDEALKDLRKEFRELPLRLLPRRVIRAHSAGIDRPMILLHGRAKRRREQKFLPQTALDQVRPPLEILLRRGARFVDCVVDQCSGDMCIGE